MTKKKDDSERIRKAYAARGCSEQTRFTFRIDNENMDWLAQQPNKGRYINNLIASDRQRRRDGD